MVGDFFRYIKHNSSVELVLVSWWGPHETTRLQRQQVVCCHRSEVKPPVSGTTWTTSAALIITTTKWQFDVTPQRLVSWCVLRSLTMWPKSEFWRRVIWSNSRPKPVKDVFSALWICSCRWILIICWNFMWKASIYDCSNLDSTMVSQILRCLIGTVIKIGF